MIQFGAPAWLLLLPVLVVFVYREGWRRHPLRIVCAVLLLLLLIDPQIRRLSHGLDLWVLEDQSASAADSLIAHRQEIETLLERSRGTDDRLIFVDYASLAQLRVEADPMTEEQKQQTRTGLAVRYALSRMSAERASRILVITDGYSTESLVDLAERLNRQQVALDYRLLISPTAADYRVARLDLPTRAQTGEPFLLEAEISGQPDGVVDLEVSRDGVAIGQSRVTVKNGTALVRFTDRILQAGAHRYAVDVRAAHDAIAGNNHAEKWIEIAGGPRILLLTNYADDPLSAVLQAQEFEVQVIDPRLAQVGQLSGARAVILNNVPAYQIASEFLHALDFYVRAQGGGLLMAGGKWSFGSGGYFQSPIDPLLPISMELRTEQRKLAVAMSVVLDRSGSMAAAVAPHVEKIDLADEGAARTIDLLGSMDAVSVFAVDTQPHEVVPLTTLAENREPLIDAVRRITSGGGGICVPTGLRAAWDSLKEARVGQRHVVLFADANDATQELGDYQSLIRGMVADGITISVIGLGHETDSGGNFLRDVADLGKGRIYFSNDAAELPAIFAQETVAVARSAFIEQPVKVVPTSGWLALAASPLPWLEAVDGYNLSYLKPEATAAALSGDQYHAPLVAFWQRGAGRVAAVSFSLGGDFSQRIRTWDHYADFVQSLARWLAGDRLPPGLNLQTHLIGTTLKLDLYYDDNWEALLAQTPPRILVQDQDATSPRELTWQRLSPGHFSSQADLSPEQWIRGVVQVQKFALPFGPIVAGSNVEWTFDRARLSELQALARESGGVERFDLAQIWKAPRRAAFYDPRNIILSLLLIAFVVDAMLARLGWNLVSSKRSS